LDTNLLAASVGLQRRIRAVDAAREEGGGIGGLVVAFVTAADRYVVLLGVVSLEQSV